MSRTQIEVDPDAVTNARAVVGAPFARRPDQTRNVPVAAHSRVDTSRAPHARANPRIAVERRWPLWLLTFVCAAALVSAGYLAALVQVQYRAGHEASMPLPAAPTPGAARAAAAPSHPQVSQENAQPARARPPVGTAQEPRRVLPRARVNAKRAVEKRPDAVPSDEQPSDSPTQGDPEPVLRILPLRGSE